MYGITVALTWATPRGHDATYGHISGDKIGYIPFSEGGGGGPHLTAPLAI